MLGTRHEPVNNPRADRNLTRDPTEGELGGGLLS